MKRRNEVTDTVLCIRDGEQWGEYVTAGDTYEVTYPEHSPRATVHFRNLRTGGGTYMAVWAFLTGIERGHLQIVV